MNSRSVIALIVAERNPGRAQSSASREILDYFPHIERYCYVMSYQRTWTAPVLTITVSSTKAHCTSKFILLSIKGQDRYASLHLPRWLRHQGGHGKKPFLTIHQRFNVSILPRQTEFEALNKHGTENLFVVNCDMPVNSGSQLLLSIVKYVGILLSH